MPRIHLTHQPIDPASLVAEVTERTAGRAGAVVLFLGNVREWTGPTQTTHLTYEAHEPLALAELQRIIHDLEAKYPILDYGIVHRLGTLALGETSVALVIAAPHRKEAFHACEELMERIKQSVAIWKQDHFPDGASTWQHPTV